MKSNKRAVIVLMTAFVFLLIGGILMQVVNNRDTEEKEQLIKPEELMEHFGFTEEEIEGMKGCRFTYVVYGEPLKGVKPDYDNMRYIVFRESDTIRRLVFIDMKGPRGYISSTTREYVYQVINKAEVVMEVADLTGLIELY